MPDPAPTHRSERQDKAARRGGRRSPAAKEAKRIRSSNAWQRLRAAFLADPRNAICCDPFGVHAVDAVTVATDEVHHIQGVGARPDLALSWDNLAPLCSHCHYSIEARERRGMSTAGAFRKFTRKD